MEDSGGRDGDKRQGKMCVYLYSTDCSFFFFFWLFLISRISRCFFYIDSCITHVQIGMYRFTRGTTCYLLSDLKIIIWMLCVILKVLYQFKAQEGCGSTVGPEEGHEDDWRPGAPLL